MARDNAQNDEQASADNTLQNQGVDPDQIRESDMQELEEDMS